MSRFAETLLPTKSAENFVGRNDVEIGIQNAQWHTEQDEHVLHVGEVFQGFETRRGSSGEAVHLRAIKVPVTAPDGSRLVVGYVTDITHERMQEEKLTETVRGMEIHAQNERSFNRCLELINASALDKSMPLCLRELGEKSCADRCGIFLFDEGSGRFRLRHVWVRDEHCAGGEEFIDLPFLEFSHFHEYIRRHLQLEIQDISNPPVGFEEFAREVARLGPIQALLLQGIWMDGKLYGASVLEFREPYVCGEDDYRRVQNMGNLYLLGLERERRVEEIERGALLQRQIVDSIGIPLLLFDLEYNIVSVNQETVRLLQRSSEELIGTKCYRSLCGLDAPPPWCPMCKTVQEKGKVQVDFNGHGREFIITTVPIYDTRGKMIYVLETALDVVEVRAQERQLQTLNVLLNSAASLAHITYFSGDKDARITLIGGDSGIGAVLDADGSFSLMDWMIPEDREEFEAKRRLTVAPGEYMLEMTCRARVGEELRNYSLLGIRSKHDPELYIGVLQDITARVLMEDERQDLIRSLHDYVKNERVVNECLTQIVVESSFDRNVEEVLKLVATQLDCDRVWLGQFMPGRGVNFPFEWSNEGSLPLAGLADDGFRAQIDAWTARFAANELITVGDVEKSDYAAAFRLSGCRTLMCVPIWVNKALYGVLGIGFKWRRETISALDGNILRSVSQIIGLAREQEMQREKLEILDQQNRLILEAMPIATCLFDGQRNLLRLNPAVCSMFGGSPEQFMNAPCYVNICKVPGGLAECPVALALQTGTTQSMDVVIDRCECRIMAIPVLGRNGEVLYVVENILDLTDINEGRRKLEAALVAAEAASRAKGFFFATMSHELRTPLNAVIGFSELLQKGDLEDAERGEYLESINLAGNSLLFLINDILDLSKLEADQLELVPQPSDIGRLLQELKAVFGHKVREQGLYFDLRVPENLPLITLDSQRLRQILLNLIGNAVKFTHAGGITVTVDFQAGAAGRGTLRLSVRDTGIGVKKEAQEKIFEPFVQQDALRDTHMYKGSGLGLAITRRLLLCMGGTVRLVSDEGMGCDFIVEFPKIPYSGADLLAAPATFPAEEPVKALRGRVLLVDDIALNLKVLAALLRKMGMESLGALSGEEALRILEEDCAFDAVMTDMWMPGMSGAALAAALRGNPRTAHIPVVAVTADTEAAQNFSRAHLTGIMLKPVTEKKMRNMFSLLHSGRCGWDVV